MFTTLGRIIRNGFVGFYRNRTISVSAIVVMTITLIIIGGLVYSRAMLKHVLYHVQNKVDVSVYFVLSAEETDILKLQDALTKLPEVKEVRYTSRDQALVNYKEKNANDALALQAIEEIGQNPFRASIAVLAQNSGQYEAIATFLKSKEFTQEDNALIDKIDYADNKEIIDRLNALIATGERAGLMVALIFILISSMITYNTIRLAIYTFRDEISVMRLVGANKMYVRGPFVVEGILYGVFAAILATLIFLPIALYTRDYVSNALVQFDTLEFYMRKGFLLGAILLSVGIALGTISSYLSVRKYLNR
jgi:cell division transport system permease protein